MTRVELIAARLRAVLATSGLTWAEQRQAVELLAEALPGGVAALPPDPTERTCAGCGLPFRPARSDARTCSARCRQAAHRRRIVTVRHG